MTAPAAERAGVRQQGRGIGRAAVMIGVITVLARAVGFGRQVVFAHTVGTTCLGTAYTTANMVPNIIYDIVLGGALSSVVVPVLAGSAGLARVGGVAGEPARQIAAALLTWTVLLLVPVSAGLAVAARPIVTAALSGASGCPHGSLAGVGSRMLIVFAPQVLLYGLAVVLYGILQANRRFGAPSLAPLLSSLVVVGVYSAFGAVGGEYVNRLDALPAFPEYLLSGGTTLGVLALVLTAVVPAWRLRLGLRSPTLRFPAGVGARVRKLAIAGVLTLVAQDASVAVVIVLANRFGHSGALVLYGFAWAVFVVPYAVLAVPIATSAFPELSELAQGGQAGAGRWQGAERSPEEPAGGALSRDGGSPAAARYPSHQRPHQSLQKNESIPAIPAQEHPRPLENPQACQSRDGGAACPAGRGDRGFDATAAASTRAVLLASLLGAAVLAGARTPLARVFESHSPSSAWVLATSLGFFAPGLVGYGLSANLSRVLYAVGRNRAPALAISAGWLLVIAADLAIVPFIPRARVVPALGLGTSMGLTVAGIALLVTVRLVRGSGALAGTRRAFLAGLAGCVGGAAAGSALSVAVRVAGFFPNVGVSVLVSAVVTAVFALIVISADGGDLWAALRRLRAPRVPVS